MKRRRSLVLIGILVLTVAALLAAEPISQLKPSNYVNDFAGVLDASTLTRLNDLCKQVDEKAHAQIAVVTVKSVDGQDIVSYAVALYQKWGIGKKGTDRGVLILLAVQDRKYWTTTGYGLEPILPDGKVGGFGREAVPFLRNGDYSGAVTLMTSRVAEVIAKDAGVTLEGVQTPRQFQQPDVPNAGVIGFVILLVLFLIFALVVWAIAKSRGGGPRGSGGSGLWSALLWSLLLNSGSRGGGGWGGGGWGGGGFGGGGGGFGGFGGGGTGGGGAGGSW